jgi:CheY-like chemotaxis protein
MAEPLNVLIADDDEGHATLVRRHMRRAGIGANLIHLQDGQDVLDYLYRRGAWSDRAPLGEVVLILDLNMPRLDGPAVLRHLKRDPKLMRIPVFVLTTSDNPVEIDRCYALGASACLVKPVDFGAFGDMIQRFTTFLLIARLPTEEPPAAMTRHD